MSHKIAIITPLFNDWDCLYKLVEDVRKVLLPTQFADYRFVVVNDCSSLEVNKAKLEGHPVEIINLNKNLGHQKSIAIGISYLNEKSEQDFVVVMDVDGEDKPEHLLILLEEAVSGKANEIVFARRTKRKESFFFKIFYKVYKLIFIFLTGKVINFGNFSVIPKKLVDNVAHISDIWNHYPGGVIRSRLLYKSVGLERGERYMGKSKMNYTSLVIHGLSAVAVYVDTVSVRLLIAVCFLILLALFGISLVYIFSLSIPFWGLLLFFGILMQAFLSTLILVFTVLSYRVNFNFLPAVHFQNYIQTVEKV
ncbi:glycosyl transferase family 2 [Emticicia oligotrophica DSM 17448]|uniref:Glycosyl transferase family 2 n=1 Tax=Emticicia oligotrophica (strain DSM 17448 / CIP 109782 / MTCC 6937 / GPTSA100-15) TaxID=929562 RepID=A0ABN4ALC7_EMTOG|nr:glycosyltransferase [Emticicia oligotrophica]AFK03056.1 glycosyl transferase family 2 [Emticicia oligotrophica DSM 17448]